MFSRLSRISPRAPGAGPLSRSAVAASRETDIARHGFAPVW